MIVQEMRIASVLVLMGLLFFGIAHPSTAEDLLASAPADSGIDKQFTVHVRFVDQDITVRAFGTRLKLQHAPFLPKHADELTAGDLNGDGRAELYFLASGSRTLYLGDTVAGDRVEFRQLAELPEDAEFGKSRVVRLLDGRSVLYLPPGDSAKPHYVLSRSAAGVVTIAKLAKDAALIDGPKSSGAAGAGDATIPDSLLPEAERQVAGSRGLFLDRFDAQISIWHDRLHSRVATFQLDTLFALSHVFWTAKSFRVLSGDFFGDGIHDVLLLEEGTTIPRLVFRTEFLALEKSVSGLLEAAPAANLLASGDFDGDGTDELLAVEAEELVVISVRRSPSKCANLRMELEGALTNPAADGELELLLPVGQTSRLAVQADEDCELAQSALTVTPTAPGSITLNVMTRRRSDAANYTAEISLPFYNAGPYSCIGFNRNYELPSYAWRFQDYCPEGYAALEATLREFPGVRCCRMPDNLLSDLEIWQTEGECPAGTVVTALVAETLPCRGCKLRMRCTGINSVQYRLGASTPGSYVGDGHEMEVGTKRTLRQGVPFSFRYMTGRVDIESWNGRSCLGQPWGSLYVGGFSKDCSDLRFSSLKKAHDESPVEGFPLAPCSSLLDPFNPLQGCKVQHQAAWQAPDPAQHGGSATARAPGRNTAVIRLAANLVSNSARELENGTITWDDAVARIIHDIFHQELTALRPSETIELLYRTLFGREPVAEELQMYEGIVDSSALLKQLLSQRPYLSWRQKRIVAHFLPDSAMLPLLDRLQLPQPKKSDLELAAEIVKQPEFDAQAAGPQAYIARIVERTQLREATPDDEEYWLKMEVLRARTLEEKLREIGPAIVRSKESQLRMLAELFLDLVDARRRHLALDLDMSELEYLKSQYCLQHEFIPAPLTAESTTMSAPDDAEISRLRRGLQFYNFPEALAAVARVSASPSHAEWIATAAESWSAAAARLLAEAFREELSQPDVRQRIVSVFSAVIGREPSATELAAILGSTSPPDASPLHLAASLLRSPAFVEWRYNRISWQLFGRPAMRMSAAGCFPVSQLTELTILEDLLADDSLSTERINGKWDPLAFVRELYHLVLYRDAETGAAEGHSNPANFPPEMALSERRRLILLGITRSPEAESAQLSSLYLDLLAARDRARGGEKESSGSLWR